MRKGVGKTRSVVAWLPFGPDTLVAAHCSSPGVRGRDRPVGGGRGSVGLGGRVVGGSPARSRARHATSDRGTRRCSVRSCRTGSCERRGGGRRRVRRWRLSGRALDRDAKLLPRAHAGRHGDLQLPTAEWRGDEQPAGARQQRVRGRRLRLLGGRESGWADGAGVRTGGQGGRAAQGRTSARQ